MFKRRASNSSLFFLLVLSLAGLAVQCGNPPGPTQDQLIVLSATSRSFTATQGGASPAAQTVTVSNGGGGTLSGLTATVSYTTGQGWLAASLSSTTAPSTLTLTATTGTLVAGTYTATVAVAAAGAANSPQPVSVTFTLGPSAPAAPSNLAATAVSSSQINLSWTDNATTEDGFQIERCSGAGCTAFTQIATVGPNVTTYSNTGLAASTSYSYRVRANNGAGSSAYSNTATATTSLTAPAAPTNLLATAVSSSQINLSWTDNATNEDGFQIERCSGAGCTAFTQIATVGSNVTTYSNTGLAASTSYSYRVRANNGAGSSAYSNTATATTSLTAPAAPTNLLATAVSSSQINLSWTDNATNEDGFQIERCSGAACTAFTQIATVGPNVTTYSNTGLAASTSYSYRVRANNGAGSSAYSNTATATTSLTAPAAPTNLLATAASSSQINLSWTDNATNEDGFQIERCSGAACTAFTQIATVGPNVTAYSNTGLAASTSYSYRVRANNGAGSSAYSNTATATTSLTAPAAPTNLLATAVSSSQINLSWTDNATNEDGFQIERCSGAGCTGFAQIATVGSNVTTYSNTGLAASTSYSYRVRANNGAGSSGYSNTATATTSLTAPAAPTNLLATAVSSSQINLSWTDNATTEDGFQIERCSGAGCTAFTQIATVGPNVTAYSNTGLAASTSYSYRVRANNGAGSSAYSNTATATTSLTAPAAPTNLLATAVSSSQINLSWTDNATNEDGFQIERCSGAGCTAFTQIATVGSNVTTYSNTGLAASTSYSYRVRANNGAGSSAYSNTATATTSLTAPAAPTNLLATAVSSSQINLSWTDNATTEDGFQIERCLGGSCTTFVEITTLGANSTTYQNTGLLSNTSYSYRVRAYNALAQSGYSNTASAITPQTLPLAPSSLATNVISSAEIDLSWIDNSTNESEFLIERCTGSGCTTFTQIASVNANITTYQNTGLGSPITYRYRVRAHNTAGYSAYSNTADGTTPQIVIFPGPTSLTATTISPTQINLAWVDRSSTETGFEIERCSGVGCSTFALLTTVGMNVQSYQNTGLTNGTSYTYRVRAYIGTTTKSAYSNTATAVAGTVISTTRFQNNAVWAVISLAIDGTQYITVPGTGIAPGYYYEVALTPGTHQLRAATGYWDGNYPYELYIYPGPFTQVSGVTGTITIDNPTIAQILTNFSASRLWSGVWYDSNSLPHTRAFRFYSGGTCRLYYDGVESTTCTFSLVTYNPGLITFRVRYANGTQYDGLLDELNGYFFMDNGPSGWATIQYSNTLQP